MPQAEHASRLVVEHVDQRRSISCDLLENNGTDTPLLSFYDWRPGKS